MTLLGVDLGDRRIGLAVGDLVAGVARPLTTIGRRDTAGDITLLRTIVAEHHVDGIVVGLPLTADGSEGPQATSTRTWAEAVAAALGVPVSWQDERHTSMDAETRLGGPGRGRSGGPPSGARMRGWRARIDRAAATAILQAALDAGGASTERLVR